MSRLTFLFVRVVPAVVVIVALPSARDAAVVPASELVRLTRPLSTLFFWFVRGIATVVLAVTLPACGNAASRVLASELIHTTRHLSAVGRFIGSIRTVVVPVTHPEARYAAFGHCTLELGGSTCNLRAVLLILALSAIFLTITAEDSWDAAVRVGTFELAGQANVNITVGFVGRVLAVVISITDVSRVGADARATLKLSWSAFKLRTVVRLV